MRLIRLLKKDLARETAQWAKKQLITTEQARAICRSYGIDYDAMQHGTQAMGVTVALAYLFMGLALLVLIGNNWEEIPRSLRMLGLIALTVGVQALAIRALLRGRQGRATLLFLLGGFCFGASILLIAQIYHLGEHYPDALFWWAAGTMPIALLLHNPTLGLFSLLLGLLWFWLETGMDFLAVWFPAYLLAALYILLTSRPHTPLFLTIYAGAILWFGALLAWIWADPDGRLIPHIAHIPVITASVILGYAFSCSLRGRDSAKAKDYAAILSVWSLRFMIVILLLMSYVEIWQELIAADWQDYQVSVGLWLGGLLGASVLLGWQSGRLPLLGSLCAACAAATGVMIYATGDSVAIVLMILDNIALVAIGAGLILYGTRVGISHYYFLGVLTIMLVALLRYFDLVGGYVGTTVLLFMLALVLLATARYWKQYQKQHPPEGPA